MTISKHALFLFIFLIPISLQAISNNYLHLSCDVEDPLLDCDNDGTPNGTDTHPLDPCQGGSLSLESNDCDGDGLTVGDGDPDDQDYCNPIAEPECENSSSVTTISQVILSEPCSDSMDCFVLLSSKVFLQGAYDQDYPELMHDKLRVKQLIPLQEPYASLEVYEGEFSPFKTVNSGGEITTAMILEREGERAIVDWIFLELRDANDPKIVLATRSALLQRNGKMVDVDGQSPIKFKINMGNYFIAIKHRNHLGTMTKFPIPLMKEVQEAIDFSDIKTPLFELADMRKGSDHAQKRIDNKRYLWGGNTNADQATIYQGPGLDQTKVFYDIFSHSDNVGPDGLPNYNYILRGYFISDDNMDGEVRYQGPNNDVDELQFFNTILHPENPNFFMNKIIYEQIPSEEK